MTGLITKTNRDLLMELLRDPDRKPIFRIFTELLILLFRFREVPVHYFSKYLFKKQIKNIEDYLPNKFGGKISHLFNDSKIKEILDNKLFFDFYYRQFKVSLPEILMYNHKTLFIVGDKCFKVTNIFDFTQLLKNIFNSFDSGRSIIIKKTSSSSSGRKIFRLYKNMVQTDSESIHEIYSEAIKSGFLFQKSVKQHPDLNKLNPSCLNTMRIDTFMDSEGNIDIISGYIRMSICGNHIDNISSGGCQVGIVLQTGRLKKNGYSLIKTKEKKILTEHPITRIPFENFPIPYFNEAKELVLGIAGYNPELRLIGWDVAIDETGPVLIEGNSDYDVSGNDLAEGGYFANNTFKKVLREINYL